MNATLPPEPAPYRAPRRFYRSSTNRVLSGVCTDVLWPIGLIGVGAAFILLTFRR